MIAQYHRTRFSVIGRDGMQVTRFLNQDSG